MRETCSAFLILSVLTATVAAVQTDVDLLAIDEALTLIRSGSTSELARFNELYRVKVEKAPVDYLEVVTPFRRIVLTGAARATVGDRSFGQRQAIDLLAESGGRLDVYAELTLNPLNNYIGVPDYVVALINGSGMRTAASEVTRLSRWTARLPGPPAVGPFLATGIPRGAPLVGATIIAGFELKGLMPAGTYEVVVELGKEEVARAAVVLSGMR